MANKYDIVLVGSSFATTFFLESYLKKAPANARVIVLERGPMNPHSWQIENRRTSNFKAKDIIENKNENKFWALHTCFGGASNVWTACAPRMLPNDFKIRSKYGVGFDWPITYDELEAFYCQVEDSMSVSGVDHGSLIPRSCPFPQPPHTFSDPDKVLNKAYPGLYFPQSTARTRVATANRPKCCTNNVCTYCPTDAKFTILNEMGHVYQDSRVTLITEAHVQSIEYQGDVATGVNYVKDGVSHRAECELIGLGAGAIFNPYIMLRSGLSHPMLGKNLCEQVSVSAKIFLDGLDNFQGSTIITGQGYMLYDGEHRSSHAACLIESSNTAAYGALRREKRKWRQLMIMRFIFEDIPQTRNYVKINEENQELPETVYEGHSEYAQRGLDALPDILPEILEPLPIESIEIDKDINSTDGHILGTTVMGEDPEQSIVDRYLVHHQIRNLVILGSGVFPTASPANPTLTLSALSLWAAKNMFG